MHTRALLVTTLIAATLIAASDAHAQRGRGRSRRTADRNDYPQWKIDRTFEHDVFTFVRIQFDSAGYGARGGGGWRNDFPDCDWNFSFRLQQLTSLHVDPNGRHLRLTDPALLDYPFIYMSNPNRIRLSDDEVAALRRYLLRGGFLMADDFWAPAAWAHVYRQMKRVFPDREPQELTLEHEIFHIVYDLKTLPQIPSIFAWRDGDLFEYWHGDPEGDEDPHFWAFFDDHGRIMALLCHNNDIGDGWEREGEEREYFVRFSEKQSYPLGINIVTYVMTH